MKLYHHPRRNLVVKETTDEELYKFGVKSISDIIQLTASEHPTSFDIVSRMSPVKNQGQSGVCTTFCVNSNLEFVNGRAILSEACITDLAEKSYGDCKEGLAMVHAYQACHDQGIVAETEWVYNENIICWHPAPNIEGKQRFRFSIYFSIYNRSSISIFKNMLNNNRFNNLDNLQDIPSIKTKKTVYVMKSPVSVDVPVWFTSSNLDAGWDFGPNIHMPTPIHLENWLTKNNVKIIDSLDTLSQSPGNESGWHCISICGYDDSKGWFIFKNSWGNWWGTGGYGTIPYEYIDTYSRTGMLGLFNNF